MSSSDLPEDPESLTVATLTSILSEHGVSLPSKKEKKSFYVDLYKKELLNKDEPVRAASAGRRKSTGLSPRKSRTSISTPSKEPSISAKSPSRGRSIASEAPVEASVTVSRSPPPNITAPKLLQQVSLGGAASPPRPRSSFFQQITNNGSHTTPISPPRKPPSFSAATTFEGFTPVPPPAQSPTRSRDQSPPREALFAASPTRHARRGSLTTSSDAGASFSGSFSAAPVRKHPSKYSPIMFFLVIAIEVALVVLLAKYLSFGALFSFLMPQATVYCDTYVVPSSSQNCTQCPPFAKCENGALIGCDAGYKLHRNGKSCIKDTELDAKVSVLRDRMVEMLAQRAGEVECKVRESSDANVIDAEMQQFAREVLSTSSESDLEEIYRRVKHDAKEGTDTQLHFNDYNRWYTSAKTIPIWCRIEQFIMRLLPYLIGLAILGVIFAVFGYRKRSAERSRTKAMRLTQEVKDYLWTLKTESMRDGVSAFVAVPHLRDQFLPNASVKELEEVWRSVEREMEKDSRIAVKTRVIGGEQHLTWEWASPSLSPRKF